MLIPCEECRKKISSEAKQCPNCGHPATEEWVRAHTSMNEMHVSKPALILLLAFLLIIGLPIVFGSSSDSNSGKSAAQRAKPRDPNAVPFSRIWKDISATYKLSPALAQTMAKKVRAEGHHCGDIYSYQNPEADKYFLLCDGLTYVYELRRTDGGWTVTPDKQNPDQKDDRTVEEKAKEAGEAVRETSKGRKYRVSEFAVNESNEAIRKHMLNILDTLVDVLHANGNECNRVISAQLRYGVMSITCAEEFKPSMEYNFNLKEALGL